jgi:mono/diheme cytochrome c family protein
MLKLLGAALIALVLTAFAVGDFRHGLHDLKKAKFKITCTPCHGVQMFGNGMVAAKFMPPPDLLAIQTRNRTDGFMFSYIRHGGVVMPRYGQSVSANEAWDLVNYIRHMQKVSPR